MSIYFGLTHLWIVWSHRQGGFSRLSGMWAVDLADRCLVTVCTPEQTCHWLRLLWFGIGMRGCVPPSLNARTGSRCGLASLTVYSRVSYDTCRVGKNRAARNRARYISSSCIKAHVTVCNRRARDQLGGHVEVCCRAGVCVCVCVCAKLIWGRESCLPNHCFALLLSRNMA